MAQGALTDGLVINPDHRDQLADRGADPDLIGGKQIGAIEGDLAMAQASCLGKIDQPGSGDARQAGGAGREQLIAANQHEIAGHAFTEFVVVTEIQGFVGPGRRGCLQAGPASEVGGGLLLWVNGLHGR